jgi:anti-sigma B factor antagonist
MHSTQSHSTTLNILLEIVQPLGILGGAHAVEIRRQIVEKAAAGATVILVDCQSVTFMDSSGLGALVGALKAVRADSGQLCLCGLNQQIRMLLEMTSMAKYFPTFANREDFERNHLAALP